MSKELINRISLLAVSLGAGLVSVLFGASKEVGFLVYCITLIGLNLSDIASAIRERPLCINVDKSFVEWVIENLKNKHYEQRD